MRILCFGAGAIGTYIGGSLALSGEEVVFLERPEIAAALSQRGLRLALPDGAREVAHPRMVSSIEAALEGGAFDFAILAVKSFDTVPLIQSLAGVLDRLPPFLSLQNGVENEERLAEFLGRERVIPATVTSAVDRRDAGDIVLERLRGVGVADTGPLARDIFAAMQAAGLKPQLYANAAAMKWSKLLTNLVANASSAIMDMTPAEIFSDPLLYRLEVRQLRETLRVMAAQNIPVVNLPGTPVKLLAFGLRWLPLALLQPLLKRAAGSGRGAKMPSFHIDLYSGRKQSEVVFLNGAVVRFGQRLGVPTPVNQVLTQTLTGMAAGDIAKDSYARRPERLLQAVRAAEISERP
jgi:2-dehydropantoate 2-reductase